MRVALLLTIIAAFATLVVGCTAPEARHVTYQNPVVYIGSGTVTGNIAFHLDGGDQAVVTSTSVSASPSTNASAYRP